MSDAQRQCAVSHGELDFRLAGAERVGDVGDPCVGQKTTFDGVGRRREGLDRRRTIQLDVDGLAGAERVGAEFDSNRVGDRTGQRSPTCDDLVRRDLALERRDQLDAHLCEV